MRKTKAEVEKIRASCRAVAQVLHEVRGLVRPGATTGDLDAAAREAMARLGGRPSFLGYSFNGKPPYPAVICISVDDEVVHGIPGRLVHMGAAKPDRVLREGELVSLDCGVQIDGWHGDAAVTVPVGRVSPEKSALIDACRAALWAGLRALRPGASLVGVAQAISGEARRRGPYGIVSGYGGHGIGRRLHEPPFVPNLIDGAPGFENHVLSEGWTLALEPMLTLGSPEVRELQDRWTVSTRDGSASAHFEHTAAVTSDGFEVLTLLPGEGPP